MKHDQLLATLSALPNLARDLRAAGVVRVRLEGVELELLPDVQMPVIAPGVREAGELPPLTANPLDDPMTFGARGVPRFSREEQEP